MDTRKGSSSLDMFHTWLDRYIAGFLGPRFWHLALEKMVGQVLTWISDGGLDPRCMQRMCLERGKVEESRVHKDI